MNKRGLIFDLDGTLWDACPQIADSWNEYILRTAPQYGIRRTTGDHWAHEFTFGPRFAFFDDVALSPHVSYRLVFMF